MIPRNTPTLPEAVDARVEAFLRNLNTAAIGRIDSYDADTRRADVQLVVERVEYGEDGERTTVKRPMLVNVPVAFPRWLRFPLAAGDLVVVLFAQHSLDKLKAGGGGSSVDPGDERRHHVADAIAFPGDILEGDADAMVEFKSDGSICIGAGVMTALDGVVTGQGTDPYTGLKYAALGNAVATVRAK
jgi:hypothetical protein